MKGTVRRPSAVHRLQPVYSRLVRIGGTADVGQWGQRLKASVLLLDVWSWKGKQQQSWTIHI